MRPARLVLLGFFFFFRGMIGLICHLKQKELGHGAVDNPIYRFAIYYKFLWLLGPLSHRFVDCLLSWVLMSCCLNHCIITALIHFLAYPHTRSVGSPLLEKNGLKHSSVSRQLVTSSLKWGVIWRILPFNKWQSSCDFLYNVVTNCRFRWWGAALCVNQMVMNSAILREPMFESLNYQGCSLHQDFLHSHFVWLKLREYFSL